MPLYGTWVASMPVFCLNSSPARCGVVPTPADAIVQFARIRLSISDQVLIALYAELRSHDQHFRRGTDERNNLKLLEQVVGYVLLQDRIDHDGRVHQHNSVAIRSGARDVVGAEHATRAGFVLRHDRLSQGIAHMLREQTTDVIDDAAGIVRQDQSDRLLRKVLGRRRADKHGAGKGGEQRHSSKFERHRHFL